MMKMVASFDVSGDPVSKARPRFDGSSKTYTEDKTVAAEERVQWAFLQQCKGVEVDATSRFRVMLGFAVSDRRHRDVDNLAKLVLDALNGHVWKDDWQIDELSVRRVFVSSEAMACTNVEIYTIGELP